MDQRIKRIREQIDLIDARLMELVQQRLLLAKEIGQIKLDLGLPVEDLTREAELIAKDRALAEAKNIPADLIEDLLRRLIRESHRVEQKPAQ